MKMGKHVYVQKPLTHTIAEARLLRDTARETGVATQMGNQGHSFRGARELCEMIWTGAIGPVHTAHAWTNRPTWPQGIAAPLSGTEIPADFAWDLWLGAAQDRPYNPGYAPHKWRGWIDFGCGALGDMACHIMDPVFWALKLGDADEFTVEAISQEGNNEHTFPNASVVRYRFPARGDLPACEVYWHDGGNLPERPADIPADQQIGDGEWGGRTNGSLFIGSDGYLTAGEYGTRPRLLPDERMAEYTMPDPILPRLEPANHYRNWVEACKGGEPACSNFDYSGPFTEMVLAGTVALRLGRPVRYSLRDGTCPDDPQAQALLTKEYRAGHELPV
jgi:predicted dehydrogenase